MPNTGRPSRDCHACRKRRVKCDLTRPHCNRCVRRGQLCPGYRDEVNVLFRVENVSSFPFVMNRDNRRRRTPEEATFTSVPDERQPQINIEREEGEQRQQQHRRYYAEPTTDSTFSQDRTPSPASSGTESPAVRRFQLDSAKTDFRPLIMARIMTDPNNNHPVDELNEVFDSIRRTIRQADAASPIHQVCNAIGLAYLASKTRAVNSTQNRVHADRSALVAVNSALQDPQRRSLDSTLLAVWMFNVYEFLSTAHMSLRPEESSKTEVWCRGISQLIRVRGPEQYTRQDGRNLIWTICYCIHFKCLINGCDPPAKAPSWFLSIAKHSSKSDRLMCRIWTYIYHCTRLHSRIQALLQTNDLDYMLSNSPSILQDIDYLEANVEPFTDPAIVDHDVPPPLASYPCLKPDNMSLQSMAVCSYLSNFRMHISSAALTFLREASRAPTCTPQQRNLFMERQDRCMWEFWSLSDRILGLLSHRKIIGEDARISNLGWVDAIRMYGALKTIANSQLSLSWQRKLAQNSLILFREHLGMTFPVQADDRSDDFSVMTGSGTSTPRSGVEV